MLARFSLLALGTIIALLFGLFAEGKLTPQSPPVPEGCTGDRWMIAFQYTPVTGTEHKFTQAYPWAQWFSEGVAREDEGLMYRIWFVYISPDSIVYNASQDQRAMMDLFVRQDGLCLFSGAPTMVDGFPYHVDLASPDTAS